MPLGLGRAGRIKNDILLHLKHKYGKDFTALSLTLRARIDSKDVLTCFAENTDPKKDLVTANRWGTFGRFTYDDTYFSVKIRPEVEGLFYKISGELSVNARINYTAQDFFNSGYDKSKGLDDVFEDGNYKSMLVSAVIETQPGRNPREMSEEFAERMLLTRFQGTFVQYYLKSEHFNKLDSICMDELLYEKNGYIEYHSRTICLC